MQLAVAAALRSRWPEAQIAIHTPNPEDDRSLYKDLEIVACSRRRPLAALRAVMRAGLWRATGGLAPLSPELRSYRAARMVIDLSGDGLTETFGWRCPLSHTVPLLLARLLRTPFCLMAQTIGPFSRFRPWYRWIVGRATFITARDEETFRYLSGWGLSRAVEQTADLAFLLAPAPRDEARRYLQSLAAYNPAQLLLGITPSNLHNVRAAEKGASDPFSGYLSAVAGACRSLAVETGAQVLILPHVFGPGQNYDDRRAAAALAASLRPAIEPIVITEPRTPPELKALLGCCDAFVGMRMHSVIAAVSQSVPTIALAYSPKLLALMRRLGMEPFTLDGINLSADSLLARLRSLWQNRSSVREALAQVLERNVLPLAKLNLDVLARFVSQKASETL
jgi:polysaccharide pyruvyl transferase WcaK-like protein